jgi:hypothetical protein
MGQLKAYMRGDVKFPSGVRTVMGYQLPVWQRPLVWTDVQNSAFVESLWKGIPCGTWTMNRFYDDPALDDLLIDGQQRMNALERYLDDQFPVAGYHWSEVTKVDGRFFDMIIFPSYITESADEEYLKSYYDLMNFGGTAHTADQRAIAVDGPNAQKKGS